MSIFQDLLYEASICRELSPAGLCPAFDIKTQDGAGKSGVRPCAADIPQHWYDPFVI